MYHIAFDLEFKKNPYKGKFIVIEGIDGSGKTTQAKRIVEYFKKYFKKKGIKSIYTKEPTDEVTGQLIRKVLKGKISIPPVAFQYLFAADRAVHQVQIEKYLKEGLTVVSDRYFWSSAVYGMLDRGVGFEDRQSDKEKERLLVSLSILSMYHRFILPDFTFYLRVSSTQAGRRIKKVGRELEIYEKREKLEKLRLGYEWLAKKFAKEITVIDGERSVGEVTSDIIVKINKYANNPINKSISK